MLPHLLIATVLVSRAFRGSVELTSLRAPVLIPRAAGDISEFIALGDSSASGVGAGVPDQSVLRYRCLRCDRAHPRVLSRDTALQGPIGETRLTNNACFGQTIPEILNTQFGTTGSLKFKAFRQPQFATISAAGDDIEFKELVLSCIYEYPYKPRKCQDQIARSNNLLNNPAFVGSIQNLIQTTLDMGLVNHNDFRVYYLGYAQFFNTAPTTPDFCSERTWSLCKFWQLGCEKLPLDINLRTQLNQLATTLNTRIQTAVNSFADTNKDANGRPLVKYIDIDSLVQGHRYCEQGKQEPVNNDNDIWFFQWLDDETTDDDDRNTFYDLVANNFTVADIQTFQNESLGGGDAIGVENFLDAEVFLANFNTSLAQSIDAEAAITNRVKTFHPTIRYHAVIEQKLIDLITVDYPAPPLACDFSQRSCDSFQSTCTSGANATCVEDEGTGGGQCQCLSQCDALLRNLAAWITVVFQRLKAIGLLML